jgi:hypothetical protein
MVYPQDEDAPCVIVELVDDAVGAASGRPQSSKLVLQLMSDPARVVAQWSHHELDHRRCHSFGKTGELSFGRWRYAQRPGGFGHCRRYLARSSSAETM